MTERSANPNRQTPSAHPEFEGREGRPENEVADQDAVESEKSQGADVGGYEMKWAKNAKGASRKA